MILASHSQHIRCSTHSQQLNREMMSSKGRLYLDWFSLSWVTYSVFDRWGWTTGRTSGLQQPTPAQPEVNQKWRLVKYSKYRLHCVTACLHRSCSSCLDVLLEDCHLPQNAWSLPETADRIHEWRQAADRPVLILNSSSTMLTEECGQTNAKIIKLATAHMALNQNRHNTVVNNTKTTNYKKTTNVHV